VVQQCRGRFCAGEQHRRLYNTANGYAALYYNTAGDNTANGYAALFHNTSGESNTAGGSLALFSNTTGGLNTATGFQALHSNTTGDANMANGAGALQNNTAGTSNTANGASALFNNTEGDGNVAVGYQALLSSIANGVNTKDGANVAVGFQALQNTNGPGNSSGGGNNALGEQALQLNTTGFFNNAFGYQALQNDTTGAGNTAIGDFALFVDSGGINNTAIGSGALLNNTTGFSNIALGREAGGGVSTADHVICIGAVGANVNFGCFIGNIYSNVQPVVGIDPDYVTVNSVGRLGRGNVSSRRYKHDIKPMEKASDVLFALKPVSFRYNEQYDATQTIAFGLIAEEVAEVYPDLVGRNAKGQPESVRYDQINAMLLNEFLKEHRQVEEQNCKIQQQETTITQLKKEMGGVVARLKEQASQIQKVSAQLEVKKPARRTVLNDQ